MLGVGTTIMFIHKRGFDRLILWSSELSFTVSLILIKVTNVDIVYYFSIIFIW